MKYGEEMKLKAQQLHVGGMTAYKISFELGIPPTTVYLWLSPERRAAKSKRDTEYLRKRLKTDAEWRRKMRESSNRNSKRLYKEGKQWKQLKPDEYRDYMRAYMREYRRRGK